MAQPHAFWNAPTAYMGFVGFVRILGGTILGDVSGSSTVNHDAYVVRATSASMNLSQEITKPEVIDSRYDKTVYQLGPRLVDGNLEFPAIYEVPLNNSVSIFEVLYRYAITRNNTGAISPFDMEVKYAAPNALPFSEAEFKYTGCIMNTWQFSVAQSDYVKCTCGIIGVDRETSNTLNPPGKTDSGCTPLGNLSNGRINTTRVVTWNDARVELEGSDLVQSIGGQYIRTFEFNINNDAERYYTLNTYLFAQAIAPRKRDIEGTIEVMGRHPDLANMALNNQDRCSANLNIKFGFSTPQNTGCAGTGFNTTVPNCVISIEEMSLSNDVFVTTHKWTALPNAGTGVCDPLLTNIGTTTFDYEADR